MYKILRETIISFRDSVMDIWDNFRLWCWRKDTSSWMETIATSMMMGILCAGAVFLLPFLVVIGAVYLLCIIGVGVKNLVLWLQDKVAITFVCTLAGLLIGVCGGSTLSAIGAAFGFFLGVVFELIRYNEIGAVSNTSTDNKGWFSEFAAAAAENQSVYPQKNTYNGRVRTVSCEKPWTWKGFQVNGGPREDDLRRTF